MVAGNVADKPLRVLFIALYPTQRKAGTGNENAILCNPNGTLGWGNVRHSRAERRSALWLSLR